MFFTYFQPSKHNELLSAAAKYLLIKKLQKSKCPRHTLQQQTFIIWIFYPLQIFRFQMEIGNERKSKRKKIKGTFYDTNDLTKTFKLFYHRAYKIVGEACNINASFTI